MRNGKRMFQLCSIALLALSICSSCLNKSSDTSLDKSYGKSDSTEIYHTIVSDDSLVTAIWYDTGEGGTAPDQKTASCLRSIALCFDLPILMMITATMKCRR